MQNVFFCDIETISAYQAFAEAPEQIQELFRNRFRTEIAEKSVIEEGFDGKSTILLDGAPEVYKSKAALHAEFGKIVCVSIGRLFKSQKVDATEKFYIQTFVGKDERKILAGVTEALSKASAVCGHNLKEFDAPFISRRCMAHGLPVPGVLSAANKKPWELSMEDTMVMWSGSAWNYKVSLELLAVTLGLPTPKGDMSGSQVGEVWYSEVPKEEMPFDHEEKVFRKIGIYCQGDVITTANVYCRMKGFPLITPDKLEFLDPMFKTNVQTEIPLK